MQSVAVLRNHVFDNAQLREFGDGHVGESGLRLGDVNGQLKRLLRSRVGALPACQSIRERYKKKKRKKKKEEKEK